MAEENRGGRPSISSRFKRHLGESPFFCKIIELLLCVISVGLFTGPFNNHLMPNLNHAGIIYVATCGFILINAVIVICYLLGEKIGKKTSLTFCGLGALLCLIAGLILINDKINYQDNYITRYEDEYLGQMMASAVFVLLASGVFIIDIYLTNKYD